MQLDLTFSLHCGNDNNDIICDIQEQVKLLLTIEAMNSILNETVYFC